MGKNITTRFTDESAIFVFHERLQVVINFGTFQISVVKDGKVIDRVDYKGEPFSLSDLELLFKQSIEASEKL